MIGIVRLFMKVVLVAYVALLLPVMFFGLAAYADYGFRGCSTSEAFQCSDARATIILAIIYAVVGPVLWIIVRALRKVTGEGVTNA
ncbi:MAG: hypothetical protein ABIP07_09200 [Sphingomicrobium sp.]